MSAAKSSSKPAKASTAAKPKSTPPAEHISPFIKWARLGVISLALAIIIIDTTLLNVSLGTIIRDLHTDLQSIQWVITAYALTLASLTITGGRLGDLFGRKKMFILGAILFAAGSFLASISHSVGVLLIGESIIEGVGAALMMPAAAALLLSNFSGRDRAIAFGVFGGVAGAASAIGPILGGWLTTNYSWRWGFRINIFVVLILLIGSLILRETRDREEKPSLDWVGVLLSSVGLFSIVFGIIKSSDYGWWIAKKTFMISGHIVGIGKLSITPIAILIGSLLLAAFWNWERYMEEQSRTPLVSTKLFKNSQFMSGAITLLLLSLGLTGLIFALPVFLQGVLGQDALHTGLSLLPLSIALLFAGPLSGVLSKWVNPKRLIQLGLAINVVALILLRNNLTVTATSADLALALALFGLGMGFNQAQISNITLSAVSVQEAGEASGVSNTARQLGGSLGAAIIGAVLLGMLATNLSTGIKNSPLLPATAKAPIAAAVQDQSSSVEFGGGANYAGPSSPQLKSEIKKISNQATTDAVRSAMVIAIIFSILSLIAASWLPNIRNVETGQSAAGH